MQDGVLNLARVKLRDQQRLAHGPLKEYSQYGEGIPFGDAVPRAGNDSGGGQPGRILKCKGWETDPNAYIYFITQAPVWEKICDVIGEPGWKTHADYAKPLPGYRASMKSSRASSSDHDQDQVRGDGYPQQGRHPLRADPVDEGTGGRSVAARHRHRGRGGSSRAWQISVGRQSYQDVGQPDRGDALSAAREHTDEILRQVLGFTDHQVAEIHDSGALDPPRKVAAE